MAECFRTAPGVTFTVTFIYLAFLYLADADLIMPSPRFFLFFLILAGGHLMELPSLRNHILDLLYLTADIADNSQQAKQLFRYSIRGYAGTFGFIHLEAASNETTQSVILVFVFVILGGWRRQ